MVDKMKVAILADTCMEITVANQNPNPNVSSIISASNNTTATTPKTAATTTSGPVTSAPDNLTAKWVKNLSSKPLMVAQNSLLARGPNFNIVPRYSPKGEYITGVEKVCLKLPSKAAAELRNETRCLLRWDCPLKPNITQKETRAIKEIREVQTQVILTADKGWQWWC